MSVMMELAHGSAPEWLAAEMPPGYQTRLLEIERLSGDLRTMDAVARVLFKQATGLSPKQFQLEARIGRAVRLLADSDLPIREIADQTGFESVYHFSRQFKRMRGVSPAHFRVTLGNPAKDD